MIGLRERAALAVAWPMRPLRAYDWPMLAAVLAAVMVGTAMIYSATLHSPVPNAWDDLVVKQLVFATVGVALLVLLSITEYRVLLAFWVWLYAATLAALLALSVVGRAIHGSQRWFTTGIADIQPSEFAKLSIVLCLAAYFERFDIRRFRHLLGSMVLVAVPALLVLRQPDLSGAAILGAVWAGMAVAAGMRPLHFSVLALLGTPVATFVLRSGLLKPYHFARVLAWLNPAADPLDKGFQQLQTLIAVGNGGLTGTGFAAGPQSQGGWLPNPHTDNIFGIVAEDLGFVGAAGLLLLLLFIVWRILRTVNRAQDRAGALIVVGVACIVLVQAFVNVGVVLALIPVTGVSLPFISYGGSSLVALLAGIGLVQSVLVRRKSLEFR